MRQKIIELLLPVICSKGYSEMSISCISEAVNLQKSSIYHHFPLGKAQIGLEIVLFVDDTLSKALADILNAHSSSLSKMHKALDLLSDFYHKGKNSCLIDIMSIANTDENIKKAVHELLLKLIKGFQSIIESDGQNKKAAQRKAIETITRIQGSLVLARATDNSDYFRDTITDLKKTRAKNLTR